MNKPLLFVIIIFSLASCDLFTKKKNAADPDDKQHMMDADRAFSKLSVEKGMVNAFTEYLDSNGVLLRPNHMPIVGADAILFLHDRNDSSYTLQWKPDYGMVAKSGELGYTYGEYALKFTSKDTVIYGTYVSIWKKQADGSWKYVLDSGNEGVGEPQ